MQKTFACVIILSRFWGYLRISKYGIININVKNNGGNKMTDKTLQILMNASNKVEEAKERQMKNNGIMAESSCILA